MKLKPAGYGLPNFERLFIKNILVPSVRLLFTWDIATFMLKREISIIKKLVQSVDKKLCTKKIVIDRVFAIEDDSRQYSINLTLEHLQIAGYAVLNIIDILSKEIAIEKDITIQMVKPKDNKENQLNDFLEFYDKYFDFISKLDKKQSKAKLRHPWFVEFNNYDWSVFMYMHTFIHRRQIEEIINNLKDNR
jgi:hypothetical protein